jgi:hypothetical protein
MHFLNTINQDPSSSKRRRIRTLLTLIGIAVAVLLLILAFQNRDRLLKLLVKPVVINNFDQVAIKDQMRTMTVPGGSFWVISYETQKDVSFSGLVGYTTPIHEANFAILTRDILLTNGDFSNPFIIEIQVADHRYHWISWHVPQPNGSIYLLHTIPLNEKIDKQLISIQSGDAVVIKGYDIYRIDSFDPNGNYLSYWQDAGCFTTLVTSVTIYPGATSKSINR